MQPTTALALGALGVLGYNAVHRAWQERKIRAGKLQELQPQQVKHKPSTLGSPDLRPCAAWVPSPASLQHRQEMHTRGC